MRATHFTHSMNNDDDRLTEVILQYSRGEDLAAADSALVEEFRARSEENRLLLDLFRDKAWVDEQLRQRPVVPTEDIWARVLERTRADREEKPVAPRRSFNLAGLAAAVLLLLGIGVSFFYRQGFRAGDERAGVLALLAKDGHFHDTHQLPDGHWQKWDSAGWADPEEEELPDGSKVRLCFGSSLRYAPGFPGGSREVWLTGQAEFDVAGGKDQPFIVHAGESIVRVLGTRFNVMAYPGDASEITLLKGKVRVVNGEDSSLLKPADQAIVSSGRMSVRTLDHPDGTIGWVEQDPYFEFDSADLNTVVRRLARWYRVKVVYNPDHVTGASITGIFRLRDPVEVNLAHLGDAEGTSATLAYRRDTIFLSQGGANPAIK